MSTNFYATVQMREDFECSHCGRVGSGGTERIHLGKRYGAGYIDGVHKMGFILHCWTSPNALVEIVTDWPGMKQALLVSASRVEIVDEYDKPVSVGQFVGEVDQACKIDVRFHDFS